jgi:hypothetical protein
MSFWDKTVNQSQRIAEQPPMGADPQEFVLNEEAVAEIQGEQYDVFDDDEESTVEIMGDANLRLEQGRLYQMVLQGDIFADTNADPKAIRNVQREIRKFVRERMETMLGIRQEQALQAPIISSPFNDLEVTALKMLASKISNGATENPTPREQLAPAAPKRDGISSISGSLRPQAPTPLSRTAKPMQKLPQKAASKLPAKSAIKEDGNLTKAIEEMTPEELAAHDKAAQERALKKKADMPANLVPHPSAAALEQMYTVQASQFTAPGSAVGTLMTLMNRK